MNANYFLKNSKTLLIDIDGTLLKGDVALQGTTLLFEFLNRNNINFLVMTNNSTKSPLDYAKKLSQAGIAIGPENIITSSMVTASYLSENFPEKSVFVIGQSGIMDALAEKGIFPISDLSRSVDVVVVAGDNQLTYEKLKNAVLFIQRGAVFIGTNPDLLVPTEEGLVPECGTTIAAIEAATGKKALVIGKPNKFMFDLATEKLNTPHAQTAILGDRMSTDILGGHNSGITTILIQTGVDNTGTLSDYKVAPDFIVDDLFDLVNIWQNALTENTGPKNDQ
jgi:HAD superfamily hydrolase (TIGR01457 family)